MGGGIESFALSITENINKEKFDVDYLLATDSPHFYDNRVLENGNRIFYTYRLLNLWKMIKYFIKMLKIFKTEKYDLIHTNMDFFNGVNILAAKISGCPRIICHSHNTSSANGTGKESISVKIYHTIMRMMINMADVRLGCSEEACRWMYGRKWRDKGCIVLHNAIDTDVRFNPCLYNREELKIKYTLKRSLNILSIGRLCEQKNSLFLVEIAKQLQELGIDFQLGIVGTGEKQFEIENKIKEYSLNENIVLYGKRTDIPELLMAYDCFLFPSRWEGFGIALIEAQYMSNICFISDAIPPESNIGKSVTIPLNASARQWADTIIQRGSESLSLNEEAEKCTLPYFIRQIENLYYYRL